MSTHFQETFSSSSFGFFILSRGRDPVHSVESKHETNVQETELDAFQRKVSERFQDLSDANSNDLLSIPWILKLLDSFICCQEEFRIIIFNKGRLSVPSMDKIISDFFDKSVKGLDVCNAIRDGIEQIRQWQKQLEIILYALDKQMSIGEGQFRRAKKVLVDLAVGMLDEKESNWTLAHRNRSFGRADETEVGWPFQVVVVERVKDLVSRQAAASHWQQFGSSEGE